jgi:transglutaminase-like putative cysteine protease
MRQLQIEHLTTYEYSNAVEFLPHRLLLRPREGHDIRIVSSELTIFPAHEVKWHRDVYGNSVAVVAFSESASKLSILSKVHIEHYEETPLDFVMAQYAVNFPFHYDATEGIDLIPSQMSVFPEDTAPLRSWLDQFWRPGQVRETYVLLDTLNKAIATEISYLIREEPGVQSPAETLTKKSGSCRDAATLFLEACRNIGLAARFVGGYLYSPSERIGPESTHAWSEVYLPGAGWKGFDSTSGEVVGSDHIAVAVSRHPEAVPPIAGAFVGITEQPPRMKVDVTTRSTEIRRQT